MPTAEQIDAFEREFGVRLTTGTGPLAEVHISMEKGIVRNELTNLWPQLRVAERRGKNEDAARLRVRIA